jgi:hypothetical protein
VDGRLAAVYRESRGTGVRERERKREAGRELVALTYCTSKMLRMATEPAAF